MALDVGGEAPVVAVIVRDISGGVVVEREVVRAALEGRPLLGRELWQIRNSRSHRCRVVPEEDWVRVDAQHKVQVALRRLLRKPQPQSLHHCSPPPRSLRH